jgi:hypothetical protein
MAGASGSARRAISTICAGIGIMMSRSRELVLTEECGLEYVSQASMRAPRNYHLVRDPMKPLRPSIRQVAAAILELAGHPPEVAETFLR